MTGGFNFRYNLTMHTPHIHDSDVAIIKQWLGTGSLNIFGRPFAGKDTQGRMLAELFGGVEISGGEILRSHHDPAQIEAIIAQGGIIPSDFYLSMVLPYLSRPEIAQKPLILSTVGRVLNEAEVILPATSQAGHPMKAVIDLHISDADVWQRLEASQHSHDRGERSDDHREVLQNRLHEYQSKTVPVIDFYEQKGLLIRIDGTQSREAVEQAILDALVDRARQ